MAKTQEKPKPALAAAPEFNWATFWKAHRDPSVAIDVVTEKEPQAKRGGLAGHRCPMEGCDKPVTWGNTIVFSYSVYQVTCRECGRAWEMPHKYIWPLVQAAIAEAEEDRVLGEEADKVMNDPELSKTVPLAEVLAEYAADPADEEVGFLDAE